MADRLARERERRRTDEGSYAKLVVDYPKSTLGGDYDRGITRGLITRLRNPRGYECDCLPECWCKRSKVGHALIWYVPARFHKRRQRDP